MGLSHNGIDSAVVRSPQIQATGSGNSHKSRMKGRVGSSVVNTQGRARCLAKRSCAWPNDVAPGCLSALASMLAVNSAPTCTRLYGAKRVLDDLCKHRNDAGGLGCHFLVRRCVRRVDLASNDCSQARSAFKEADAMGAWAHRKLLKSTRGSASQG